MGDPAGDPGRIPLCRVRAESGRETALHGRFSAKNRPCSARIENGRTRSRPATRTVLTAVKPSSLRGEHGPFLAVRAPCGANSPKDSENQGCCQAAQTFFARKSSCSATQQHFRTKKHHASRSITLFERRSQSGADRSSVERAWRPPRPPHPGSTSLALAPRTEKLGARGEKLGKKYVFTSLDARCVRPTPAAPHRLMRS